MLNRGGVLAAAQDTATGNGFYLQTDPGSASGLLVFNAGGSVGPVQQRFTFGQSFEFRNQTDSTSWTTWKTVLHSSNFSSYAPTLTGGGASGTWSINISGNAATAGGLSVHSGTNNEVNKIVRTNASGYCDFGWINTVSGDNGTNAISRVYASSDSYIRYYTPANFLSAVGANSTYVIKSGDVMSGNLRFNNYGLGIVGEYGSSRYQNVFSMGASYVPSADGTSIASSYGIVWTHTNVAGQSKAGLAHQALFTNAGVTQTAIGTGIWTIGNITLGTTNALIYWADGNHLRQSTGTYGSFEAGGTKAGYGGMYLSSCGGTISGMYDASGNGGEYDTTTGWHTYWLRSISCLGIGGSSTVAGYRARVNGALYVDGDITAFSDRRVKDDIQTIPNGLAKVEAMRGVSYIRNDNGDLETGKRSIGVIAQEVEAVVPELVFTNPADGMKGVSYSQMVGVLIEAVKELSAKVKELEAKLEK
jgi:hypothetical protein